MKTGKVVAFIGPHCLETREYPIPDIGEQAAGGARLTKRSVQSSRFFLSPGFSGGDPVRLDKSGDTLDRIAAYKFHSIRGVDRPKSLEILRFERHPRSIDRRRSRGPLKWRLPGRPLLLLLKP